jgi:HD-GYP domain-containing protein (c-di-GMP phosphodiesterase class II)
VLKNIPCFREAIAIPHYHHEQRDGNGYPDGLKGEAIPLPARIFSVVDQWDALRSARPYRPAWSDDEAKAYLRESAGIRYDPKIVSGFLDLLESGGFASGAVIPA